MSLCRKPVLFRSLINVFTVSLLYLNCDTGQADGSRCAVETSCGPYRLATTRPYSSSELRIRQPRSHDVEANKAHERQRCGPCYVLTELAQFGRQTSNDERYRAGLTQPGQVHLTPGHQRRSRGPSTAPAKAQKTIAPPYQNAMKGKESLGQCSAYAIAP